MCYSTCMKISYKPHSLLAFVTCVSLIAYYFGIFIDHEELKNSALPILQLCLVIWVIFIAMTVVRNVKKI